MILVRTVVNPRTKIFPRSDRPLLAFAAECYGKIIIAEKSLPVDGKTIKPISVGGVAGGDKCVHFRVWCISGASNSFFVTIDTLYLEFYSNLLLEKQVSISTEMKKMHRSSLRMN
jgi:hypothetical protein